jgi:hypothetical protein
MNDREDRVRELAYFLWLEEGCPDGEAERHWRDAEAIIESDSVRKSVEGEPPGDTERDAPAAPRRAAN